MAAVATVLALGLRLYGITRESAWNDEALSLLHLDAPSLAAFFRRMLDGDPVVRPVPLYFLLEYGWTRIFGTSILAARYLSVLLGVACVPLLFGLGRRLYTPAAGGVAALLFAMSLFHIYFAQEIRFYALLTLLALISMYAFVRALEERRARWWVLHGCANALALWTHVFTPLLFLVQGMHLLIFHRAPRRRLTVWYAGHATLALVFVMWLWAIGYRAPAYAFPGTLPDVRELANTLLVFTGARYARENPAPHLPGGVSLDYVLGATLAVAVMGVAWTAWRTPGSSRVRHAAGLLLLWLLVPAGALFFLSHVWRPCFLYRYAVHSAAAVPLLAGAAYACIDRPALQRAFLALLLAGFAYQNLALPRPFRPDYKTADRLITGDAGAVVHINKIFNATGFRANTTLPEKRIMAYFGFRELCADTIARAKDGTVVWVLMYRWDRNPEFERRMRDGGVACERHVLGGMPPLIAYRVW